MLDDIKILIRCLDNVLDNFYDSCGQRDEEADRIVSEMKNKYMKGENKCI